MDVIDSLKSTLKSAFTNCDNCYYYYGVVAGIAIATSHLVYRFMRQRRQRQREEMMKGPADTVILFQLKRGPKVPCLSPFVLKLETYLRMAKIPYENNHKGIMSAKGKTPWIAYNGKALADSQFCIEFLNAERGVDLNKHLNPEQQAIAKSFQVMVDEHLYWTVVYFRWIYDIELKDIREFLKLPKFVVYFFRNRVRNMLWSQGIGRHSTEEIERIMLDDLTALSNRLGTKQYIMGDAPCEADCAIFGLLAQFVYQQSDDVTRSVIQDKFPNLHNYCIRMKERYWPDWDDIVPKKKE